MTTHSATTKRKMKQCPHCGAAISTCADYANETPGHGLDHLYVMHSAMFPGLCKVGRSHDPQLRACELCQAMPFYLDLFSVFWNRGPEEGKIHQDLATYKLENCPGVEWFRLEARDACCIVARSLSHCASTQAPPEIKHHTNGIAQRCPNHIPGCESPP